MTIIADTEEIPEHLFRYRRLDTEYALAELKAAISQNAIFLSSADQLNDPFDFNPLYSPSPLREINLDVKKHLGAKPVLNRRRMEELGGLPLTRHQFREKAGRLRKTINVARFEIKAAGLLVSRQIEEMRVACFSELGDSIPMWAHYSNNHSGICVKYALHPSEGDLLFPLPVRYQKLRPEVTTHDLRGLAGRSRRYDGDGERGTEVFRSLFLAKAVDWQYEREWRIFDRSKKPPRYHLLTGLAVVEVIVGIRARDEDIKRVKEITSGKVRLKRAVPSKVDFSLDFVCI